MMSGTHLLDREWLRKAARWSWLLLCAVLPVSGAWVPVPQAVAVALLLLVAWRIRPSVDWHVLWPIGSLYALHLIGMLWTEDLAFGLFDLQIKVGLLLMPIAAVTYCSIQPNGFKESMLAFLLGNLLAFGLSLAKAWQCQADGGAGCFSQSALSFDLHPSYAAWYACWCVAYAGHQVLSARGISTRGRLGWLVAAALLILFILMLASKSGVIGLGLVVILLLATSVRSARTHWAMPAAFIAVVALASWKVGPVVLSRMEAAWRAVELARAGDPAIYASSSGSEMRLVAWACSAELIAADPIGAGTGDIKHALFGCYEAKGAAPALERGLNSHSQFLQGGVALGWPGVLLTLLSALVPLALALRRHDARLTVFALLFLFNATVESVLEVQAGVALYGIFLGLLSVKGGRSA